MQPKQDDSSAVTVLVFKDGKEFRASRNELSAASDFFCTLLNSDMKENREGIIRLEHITETVMKDVLEFMRCGCVMITQEKATYLLEAADYLIISSLKTIVGRFLERCSSIREFLNLESQQVEQWISSNEIAVSSVEEVFKLILQWIAQSKCERKRKFEELFRHVRLPYLSRDYMCKHVITNDLVKENPSCLKLVKDALKGIYCANDNRPHHLENGVKHT